MAMQSYNKLFNTNKFPGIRIYITDNKDMIFYTRLNGKDVKIGAKSEGVNITYAYNKKKEFDAKQRNGELPDKLTKKQRKNKDEIKFDDIAKAFFDYKLEQTPEKSDIIKEQISVYEQYHKSKLGSMVTNEISSQMLQDHFKEIKSMTSARTGRPLSHSRINTIMGVIRTIFNHAIKQKLITHLSPFDIEIKKPDNKRERFLELIEINLLREEVKKKNDMNLELFLELALCTGARLDGVLNIKKKDISLSNATVNLTDFKTKNAENRRYTGFLSDEAIALINQIYTKLAPNDLVINKPYATLQNVIQPLLNKLFNDGLAPEDRANRVVIHTLRHTFASHLAIAGTPILTIKKLMNHSDINHTLRYAKLMPDSGKEMVRNLYK